MGYVVYEDPKDIINNSIGKFKKLSPTNYVQRLKKFIRQYRLAVFILKYYDASNTTSKRVKEVIVTLETHAKKYDVKVYRYRRSDIAGVFSLFGDVSKHGISKTLASWYPDLQRFLAPPRNFKISEHYHMGIFDGFALMYTHAHLTGLVKKDDHQN
jgi:hypothetical protein